MKKYFSEILDIEDETHDTKRFMLKKPRGFDYYSGQSIFVAFSNEDIDEQVIGEKRPFTLCSIPSDKHVELMIKKNRHFTQKIHNLNVGAKLEIEGPFGHDFKFTEDNEHNIIFLAGGTGINPFISIMRYILQHEMTNKITLINSNKTKKDILFEEELEKFNEYDNIKIINHISSKKGHISKSIIKKNAQDFLLCKFYICGPPKMVDEMKKLLLSLEVDEEKIIAEQWE